MPGERSNVDREQLVEGPLENGEAVMVGKAGFEDEAVCLGHESVDGAGKCASGGMVTIVNDCGRSSDANRPVVSEIDHRKRAGGDDGHDDTGFDIRTGQEAGTTPRKSVSDERFPYCAAYPPCCVEDGIVPFGIAEAAGRGDRPERCGAVALVNDPVTGE